MALTPIVYIDETGQTVDTQGLISGWTGPHSGHRVATVWDNFGVSGTVKIGPGSTDLQSAFPIPFKVQKRSTDGTITTMATGLFPANTAQISAAGMALDVTTFPNVNPEDAYAVVPAGNVVESTNHAGYFVWAEAPASGQGFNVKLLIDIN